VSCPSHTTFLSSKRVNRGERWRGGPGQAGGRDCEAGGREQVDGGDEAEEEEIMRGKRRKKNKKGRGMGEREEE
jgi:hypothetical protein